MEAVAGRAILVGLAMILVAAVHWILVRLDSDLFASYGRLTAIFTYLGIAAVVAIGGFSLQWEIAGGILGGGLGSLIYGIIYLYNYVVVNPRASEGTRVSLIIVLAAIGVGILSGAYLHRLIVAQRG